MKVPITGAAGFIGTALSSFLEEKSAYELCKLTRRHIGNIGGKTNWSPFLEQVQVVIHLAGISSVPKGPCADGIEMLDAVNVLGTIRLAEQSTQAGVKRSIFTSSAKVNGNVTANGESFSESGPKNPKDPYALSKKRAEEELIKISKASGMELVIVRPPLVYGPGVQGNFLDLVSLVKRQVPLPFANIRNKRSLISVLNLVDFIAFCIETPKAANEIFLVSDNQSFSTPELITKIGVALGSSVKLLAFPASIARLFLLSLGKKSTFDSLYGSFCIDISKADRVLGWRPKYTIEETLSKMASRTNSDDDFGKLKKPC